jgi:chemotaxis protein methyltransferase CheR
LPAALLPFALHKEALPELPAITAPAAIRAVWNAQGPLKALALCSTALEQQEPALELHYLHGLLLWELRRHPDAISALRRVLYLDRSHALAHFGLASIYESIGDYQAAQRSFLNTAIACDKLAPDSLLPFGDGLRAEGLRSAAEHGLRRLNVRKNEDD